MQRMTERRSNGIKSETKVRTRGEGPGPLGWYLGIFTRPQTWASLFYLVIGFPLGVAYFVTVVSLLAIGVATALTLVGVPLLAATMYVWCGVADFERWHTNQLLRTRVARVRFNDESGAVWSWERLKARLTNPMTWRSLAFVLARFPLGVAGFVLAAVALGIPGMLIAMPLTAELGGEVSLYWIVDGWQEGLLFVPLGLLLLPIALHVVNGVATVNGRLAEFFLGRDDATDSSRMKGHAGEGLDAVIAWRGLSLHPDASAAAQRLRRTQLRAFGIHIAIIAVLDLFIVALNGATSPDVWWSLWVIWASSFALAAHAGYLLYGWLGAHLGFFLAINVGLFVVDAAYSDSTWFYWVTAAWLPLLLAHAIADRRWRDRQPQMDVASLAAEPLMAKSAAGGASDGQGAEVSEGDDALRAAHATDERGDPGGIEIDVEMRRVTVAGAEVELTPKEFDLLALLVRNPDRPFSRDELLDRVWRNDYEITDRTVDTHVQRLRKKLGAEANAIQTVWGVGYRYRRHQADPDRSG